MRVGKRPPRTFLYGRDRSSPRLDILRTVLVILILGSLLAPAAKALPTPGLFCDPADMTLGRIFPEAEQTNDFVSYDEAMCGIKKLEAAYPDWIRHDVVAKSVGWDKLPSGHDQFDVFVVRVTNGASNYTPEQKTRILFQLSIHGNEKGGREGGLRVIEDLVRDIGMAKEHPELRADLDWMELLFVFPNPDGWTHEEAAYRANDACYTSVTCTPGKPGLETQNFVRVNGHGKDVNRQWPTVGWQRSSYKAMGEPEAIGLVDYLKMETNVKYASDIHGMLQPADGTTPLAGCALGAFPPTPDDFDPTCFGNAVTGAKGHFVLTMLPAGRQDPREIVANTALAELVKERLNSDAYFAEWKALPSAQGAWGGEFNDWGTVWDTIGYTDSGFTSDFYAQDHGLNAPGVDFELAYNHITFDNYYPGAAQRMNAYHVQIVRDIVRAFMDQAALDVQTSIDAKGTRTAYLENPVVVTNKNNMTVEGWPKENAADDAYDAAHREFTAAPNDYFVDLKPYLADGDKPAVLDGLRASDLTADKLKSYTNLIIAGSAARTLEGKPAAVAAIKQWVEAGGNLVLTDESMKLLADLGVAGAGDVDVYQGYAGATNFRDKSHDLVRDVRGLARQTFEPVPMGYGIDSLTAPVWYVKGDGFKGEVVGLAGKGQGSAPAPNMVNFGRADVGAGKVSFLGALLPDPTMENGAPYGVDAYATTYTGNQLLRNMLGWDLKFAAAPIPPEEIGKPASVGTAAVAPQGSDAGPAKVPGFELIVAAGAVGVVALLRRRK